MRIPKQLFCGSETVRKPQLEHDTLLVTSSARPVCVARKVKGYGPAVYSAHALCSFPVRTRDFWHFAVSFMEKAFQVSFFMTFLTNVIATSKWCRTWQMQLLTASCCHIEIAGSKMEAHRVPTKFKRGFLEIIKIISEETRKAVH